MRSDFSWVDYFPSYEIVTGAFNLGRYFEDDLREVNGAGVGHAMRCLLKNYVAKAETAFTVPLGRDSFSSPEAPSKHRGLCLNLAYHPVVHARNAMRQWKIPTAGAHSIPENYSMLIDIYAALRLARKD
jgi:hypothetical protein